MRPSNAKSLLAPGLLAVLFAPVALHISACAGGSTNTTHGVVYVNDGGRDSSSSGGGAGGSGGSGGGGFDEEGGSNDDAQSGDDANSELDSNAPSDASMKADTFTAPIDASSSVDAAVDAFVKDSNVPSDAPVCTSATAIIAGSTSTLIGATLGGTGSTWNVATITNGAALSAPAIVAQGSEFHAAVRGTSDKLQDAVYGSAWSAATQVASAYTNDRPALALVGSALHVLYHGDDSKYYHGTFSNSAWDAASDPVGGNVNDAGFLEDYGPSAPSVAPLSSSFVVAYDGGNGLLYDRTFTTSWAPAANQPAGTNVYEPVGESPGATLIALTGGTSDLLAVYAQSANADGGADGQAINFIVRSSATSLWSAPAMPDPNAYTGDPISLAPMSNGRAMLVFRGGNLMPYFMVYDPSRTPAWTNAAALVAIGNPTLVSPPAVATGVCGNDATVVYASSTSNLEITNYVDGGWTTPIGIPATSSLTYVGIATQP